MKNNRLSWIDFAKVISICLVTSFHTQPPLTGYVAQVIQILRLPAFFLVAGFLFDDNKFTSFISFLKHRAKQLLIPYFCFEAIVIVFLCSSWQERQEAIINALLGHPNKCMPLWFLVCLFGMQLIHYLCIQIIQAITKKNWKSYSYPLLICYIFICLLFSSFNITNHGQLNAIITNLPFYAIANCCKDKIRGIDWNQYLRISCCLFIGLFIIFIKYNYLQESSEWQAGTIYYLVHLTGGILLLPPYIATCKLFGKMFGNVRLIEYLGSNTIVILALHTYFIQLIGYFTDNDTLTSFPWLNPCITLCVVIAHIPIIWLINKLVPWILGRRLSWH